MPSVVSGGQEQKTPVRQIWWLRAAAAAIVLLVVALWWTRSELTLQRSLNEALTAATYYPSFHAQEARYLDQIQSKKEELQFDQLKEMDFPTILGELKSMENQYAVMLDDLEIYPDEEAVIRAFMRYHERQLKLLELLSKEIQKKQRDEDRTDTHAI